MRPHTRTPAQQAAGPCHRPLRNRIRVVSLHTDLGKSAQNAARPRVDPLLEIKAADFLFIGRNRLVKHGGAGDLRWARGTGRLDVVEEIKVQDDLHPADWSTEPFLQPAEYSLENATEASKHLPRDFTSAGQRLIRECAQQPH
jgi:hypothetical protein